MRLFSNLVPIGGAACRMQLRQCGGYKPTNKQTKKPSRKSNFLLGSWPMALKFSGSMQHLWPLISHPGLSGVQIQRTELLARNGKTILTFIMKLMHRCASTHKCCKQCGVETLYLLCTVPPLCQFCLSVCLCHTTAEKTKVKP